MSCMLYYSWTYLHKQQNERITVHDSFPVILLLKPCYEQ